MVTRVSRATLRRMACTVVPVLPVCDVRVGRQQVNVSQDLGEVDIRIVAEALDISNSLWQHRASSWCFLSLSSVCRVCMCVCERTCHATRRHE